MKSPTFLLPFIYFFIAYLFAATASAKEDGKAIFMRNCSACHMQGGNIMAPDKTLSKEHLEKHGRYSSEAIYQLLQQGVKGTAMMSFERLGEKKLRAVTDYVMEQAETGWSK